MRSIQLSYYSHSFEGQAGVEPATQGVKPEVNPD